LYYLPADKSYLEVKFKLTNNTASTVENVRIWVGTRDDWVGDTDRPTKQKGNLVDGEFLMITDPADRATAILISSGDEGVLFYTESDKGNTVINNYGSLGNIINLDPQTSQIENSIDGSYGFYVRMDDLLPGESEEFTWFYAAGELANLEQIIQDVADVSSDMEYTYTGATFSATTPEDATGYYIVVDSGSVAYT